MMDEDQKKCGGISLVGIIAILVSLACISIGAINIDFDQTEFTDHDIASTCRAQTKIPFYLVVAGVLNIMLMVLRLIFQVRFFSRQMTYCFHKCFKIKQWHIKVNKYINFEMVLLVFFQRCCRKCGEPGEENKVCNSLNFLCRFSCITFYDLLALALTIIWLGKKRNY